MTQPQQGSAKVPTSGAGPAAAASGGGAGPAPAVPFSYSQAAKVAAAGSLAGSSLPSGGKSASGKPGPSSSPAAPVAAASTRSSGPRGKGTPPSATPAAGAAAAADPGQPPARKAGKAAAASPAPAQGVAMGFVPTSAVGAAASSAAPLAHPTSVRPPVKYSSALAADQPSSKSPTGARPPAKGSDVRGQQEPVIIKHHALPIPLPSGAGAEVFTAPPTAAAAKGGQGTLSFGSLKQHPESPEAAAFVVAMPRKGPLHPTPMGHSKHLDIPRTMSAPPSLKQQEQLQAAQAAAAATAPAAPTGMPSPAATHLSPQPQPQPPQPQAPLPPGAGFHAVRPPYPMSQGMPMGAYPPQPFVPAMHMAMPNGMVRPPMMNGSGPNGMSPAGAFQPMPRAGPMPYPPPGAGFYTAGMTPAGMYVPPDPRVTFGAAPYSSTMFTPHGYVGSNPSPRIALTTPKKPRAAVKITRPGTNEEVVFTPSKKEDASAGAKVATVAAPGAASPGPVAAVPVTPAAVGATPVLVPTSITKGPQVTGELPMKKERPVVVLRDPETGAIIDTKAAAEKKTAPVATAASAAQPAAPDSPVKVGEAKPASPAKGVVPATSAPAIVKPASPAKVVATASVAPAAKPASPARVAEPAPETVKATIPSPVIAPVAPEEPESTLPSSPVTRSAYVAPSSTSVPKKVAVATSETPVNVVSPVVTATEEVVDDSATATPSEDMPKSGTPSEAGALEEGEIAEEAPRLLEVAEVLAHPYPARLANARPVALPSGGMRYPLDFMLEMERLVSTLPAAFDRMAAMELLDRRAGFGIAIPTSFPSRTGGLSPRLPANVSASAMRPVSATPRSSTERYNESLKNRSAFVGVMGVLGPPVITRSTSGPSARGPPPRHGGPPPMSRGGPGGGGSQHGRDRGGFGSSRSGYSGGGYRGAPAVTLDQLTKAEHAWVPGALAKPAADMDPEAALEESVLRKIRGFLNKLTMEKFDRISEQIMQCEIVNERILASVIDLIFDKVTDEPTFASMYALLCQRVALRLPEFQSWISLDVKSNNFRRLLLSKCQRDFEAAKKWAIEESADLKERVALRKEMERLSTEEKQRIAEEDYERKKMKRKALGNTRFVGELFIKGMLSERVVHTCVTQLLEKVSDPEEEDIESLCKLMTTVGPTLDRPETQQHMGAYFSRITELSELTGLLPARIRFMLKDLIDLRRDAWKGAKQSGPKTIAEVHKEAMLAQREEEMAMRNLSRGHSGSRGGMPTRDQQQRRSQDDRSGRGYGGGRDHGGYGGGGSHHHRGGGGADEWQSSRPSSSRGAPPPVTAKFGAFKSAGSNESIHLGPGGNRTKAKDSPAPTATNKFEGLLDEKEHAVVDDSAPVVVAPASPTPPRLLSPAQLEKKQSGMVREWHAIFDVKEVLITWQELQEQLVPVDMLNAYFAATIEERLDAVKKTAGLFVALLEAKLVSSEDIQTFLEQQLEAFEDIIIDVPELFRYLGIFLSRFVHAEAVSLSALPELCKPSLESLVHHSKKAVPLLLAETIRGLKDVAGEEEAARLVGAVDLASFWYGSGGEAAIQAWKDDHSFAFLAGAGSRATSPATSPKAKAKPSSDDLAKELAEKLAASPKVDAEALVAWCQESPTLRPSPEATRLVASVVLRHLTNTTLTFQSVMSASGVEKLVPDEPTAEMYAAQREILSRLRPLLCYVIGEDPKHELQVLYACQALNHDLSSPQDLLHHLFRLLHELAIVSRASMHQWKATPLPGHPSSKEAVKLLSSWFKALDLPTSRE